MDEDEKVAKWLVNCRVPCVSPEIGMHLLTIKQKLDKRLEEVCVGMAGQKALKEYSESLELVTKIALKQQSAVIEKLDELINKKVI